MRTDHPRSRGVYSRATIPAGIAGGSSPLARGLPPPAAPSRSGHRIIPARAGFTPTTTPALSPGGDHPRSRGVYPNSARSTTSSAGSSPLARGLLIHDPVDALTHRIIPARAGFTRRAGAHRDPDGDHPRSRGVYSYTRMRRRLRKGSSPLARGLRGDQARPGAGAGIIPARAGFTPGGGSPGAGSGDHPRSRGVYAGPRVPSQAMAGSSPLARGLLPPEAATMIRARIIPARAGFTCRRHGGGRDRPDHPRSRGVYQSPAPTGPRRSGSSPLARGLHDWWEIEFGCFGIIPVRAGFTPRRRRPGRGSGDHPRSRGVYDDIRALCRPPCGSSPLARGLPAVIDDQREVTRIIPARAGFTPRGPGASGPPRDHPRSRGVYSYVSDDEPYPGGSSPLARGLPVSAGPNQGRAVDHPRSRGVYLLAEAWIDSHGGSSPLARGLRKEGLPVCVLGRIIPARAGFTR